MTCRRRFGETFGHAGGGVRRPAPSAETEADATYLNFLAAARNIMYARALTWLPSSGCSMTDTAGRLYEQLLVVRCQAGDEDAFEELVARYHPRLRYYLRRMLPREDQVDDALQEVWLAAFRALPRLSDPGAVAAWLYRIARDKALVRSRRRQPEHSLEPLDVVEEPSHGNEFDREDAQEIHAALDQLTPDHKEMLVLRFLEDMTYEQMARATGCPVGTVRSRLYYAKSALRRALEQRRKT